MAMQQLQLQSQKHSASWLKIFPRDIKTLTGSSIFVKQLTALAFSCITYMRSIFPEYAYQQREIDEVKVKILSGNYDCKDAYLMTRWIKSAFNALDNKYMRELVLEILSVDNKPLEYYTIVYKYNDNGASCSFSANSKESFHFDLLKLQDATKQLITTLLAVTESLEELPEKYILQLRVNYYDQITPSHYKPKYFVHSEACNLQELDYMKHQEIGTVETPYLAMSVYSGSKLVSLDEKKQSFFKDMEVVNSQNIIEESDIEVGQSSTVEHSVKTQHKKMEEDSEKKESEPTWNFDRSADSEEDLRMCDTQIISSSESKTVNCICGHIYENDKESLVCSSDTFKCLYCECLQHLICYKKLPGNTDLYVKCCYACAKSPDINPPVDCTDPSLLKYKPRQAKHLAVYRQIIYRFQNRKYISCKTMTDLGIQSELAENMMTKLNKESFIKPKKNSKNFFIINKSRIKHFMKVYFEL